METIPLDDPKTMALFAKGETTGLFQFESPGMQKNLRLLRPERFEDVIAMNALYRPGPMEYIPQFARRKNGEEEIQYDLPIMEEILSETYGITVYQEQVMMLSRKLAGFSRGQADQLRKAMGKKIFALLEELKPKFIAGGQERGHDAEILEKRIEKLDEIKEVDILGAQDEEVEVAVDIQKMTIAQVSFDDVISSIAYGNRTIAAGNIISDGQRRTLRVIGEIQSPEELKKFVVKKNFGPVYLGDIAEINFRESEKKSYAREFGNNLVTLAVKKRSGKNLINAAETIRGIVSQTIENDYPIDLNVSITNDMSNRIVSQVDDLVNNILFGIFLVTTVLMFFLGFRNALFVGFAIPMSMVVQLFMSGKPIWRDRGFKGF